MVTMSRTGVRVRGLAVALVVALLRLALLPSRGDSHPLHTTFADLRVDAARGMLEARVRLFADDLMLATTGGATHRVGDAIASAQVEYLRNHFVLHTRSGTLAMTDCGVERRGDAMILCLRAAERVDAGALVLRNTLFTERYADQVNVVRVDAGDRTSTFLMTRTSPERALR